MTSPVTRESRPRPTRSRAPSPRSVVWDEAALSSPTRPRFRRLPTASPRVARWATAVGLVLLHSLPVAALVRADVRAADWLTCAVLYVQGALTMGVGLHRYFAHRSFRTSRGLQFALGWLACTLLTDPIRFTGKHRLHHRYADTPNDPHARGAGLWHCWMGSLIDEGYRLETIREMARDWQRFPELVFLERTRFLHAGGVALVTYAIGGFSMFAIGFCLSRVICLHAVSAVNYFGHGSGARAFETRDRSTNPFFWGWFTLGEGWHNNHHRFPRSARCGLERGQIDPAHRIIRALERLGWVWDVRDAQRPSNSGSRFSTKARAALR